ncbi:MAG: threonylcarbamoyl-AMP synthase, partial [Candidatus Omnitrophica bacterium]|nr:threonylcarbamoyl-AMP synthase [Candidatus Omnitrophota bacterium]
MKTEIITVNPDNINPVYIKTAAEKIKDGGLVAFPTETVYGLGADAFNPKAVAKIFEAKKRPFEDPLIVHIAQKEDLYKLTEDISDSALKLADEFWPGPLTLVLKKSKNIPDIITAGLDTVAIRVPADKVALAFIKFSETPIAAPSANLFGRPSPTTAQHVLDDLNEKIDIVIDGGRALIGVESTILDLTQNPPVVLRPGGVSIEKLKKVVKGVEIYKQDKILSPGMYPRHYSPKAKVMLVEGNGN